MKKWKRLACAVLALAMFTCLLPAGAFAEDAADTWDGTADTSWYDADPDADTFVLDSAEDLAGLSQLTNGETPVTFAGKTILLAADLDLAGREWHAISENAAAGGLAFQGSFDGQGHVIRNLNNGGAAGRRTGLFGVIDKAVVKNLRIENAQVNTTDNYTRLHTGVLASWAFDSIIENCSVSGTLACTRAVLIGGLVGQASGSTRIVGCGSDVDIKSTFPPQEVGGAAPAVGGLVGQWETVAENSLIADCYFAGSLNVASNQAACGGILGAHFDFTGPYGITITNCVAAPSEVQCGSMGNVTYIAAIDEYGTVTNCLWPALTDEVNAVVQLVVDWGAGTAEADPDFDQNQCGRQVESFTDAALVDELNANAQSGVTWVMGIKHPTFAWDERNLPADYTRVDAAIEQANALRAADYTDFSAVAAAVNAVDRTKSKAQQAEVDAMAQAILEAIAALEKKPAPAPAPAPADGAGQKQNPKTGV